MKAARLYKAGEPLVVEEIPEPTLRPGCVIVKVLSGFVANSMAELLSGRYLSLMLPPMPYTPGIDAIGIVEAVADDVVGIEKGQGVLDLSLLRPHVYPLDKVNEAIAQAAKRSGGFEHVVVAPHSLSPG